MKQSRRRHVVAYGFLTMGMALPAAIGVHTFATSCTHGSSVRPISPEMNARVESQAMAEMGESAPRVMIVSFDGLRPDAISKAQLPTVTSLIEEGSSQLTAMAEVPCITLPNHSSMVTGLSIAHHGVLLNTDLPGRIKSRTLFDEARDAHVPSGFFATKSKLKFLCGEQDAEMIQVASSVEAIADRVIEAIQQRDLQFIFLHFGEPDGAGHAHGWMSDKYLAAALRSDAALGRILAAMEEKGIRDETVIIVSADHGGHGKSHGLDIAEDRLIPFIIQGPGIAAGRKLCRQIRTMDTAATALHLLGLPTATAKDGRVVDEAMNENPMPECDEPSPVFSMPCGPFPPFFLGPMVIGFWILRSTHRRKTRC